MESELGVLREEFGLDPAVTFLNNGSFGAAPKVVMDRYFQRQREMEFHPFKFIIANRNLIEPRKPLADFVGAKPDNLAFVTNVTEGINVIARSLALGSGDEVLSTDHEYGAVDRTWQFLAAKRGFTRVTAQITAPVTTREAIVEQLWRGVTPRTKVIVVSHITSPTALILPVEEICARARRENITTVIDGAHAPAQIPLQLDDIGADFYCGNLHKWACCPKGTAFIHARDEVRHLIEPLVVSWGWNDESPAAENFAPYIHRKGTRDVSRFLVVGDALKFMETHDWSAQRRMCHAMAVESHKKICQWTGLAPLHPADDDSWYSQMVSIPLPPVDAAELTRRLFEDHRIEVFLPVWNNKPFLRLSIQVYNSADDVDRLIDALKTMI